jgi:hypothetical protein
MNKEKQEDKQNYNNFNKKVNTKKRFVFYGVESVIANKQKQKSERANKTRLR